MTDIHSTLAATPPPSSRPPVLYNFVSNALLPRKGGFIIHMLRQLMRDPQNGDRDFIAMMHDFTATYANRSASTEDFRATVEKHMKPAMLMDRRGNMQWFFDDWVYGSEIPSYRLEYTVAPDDGKAKVTGVLTQSGVSDSFKMRVRVYVRLGKKAVPVLYLAAEGDRSQRFVVTLPEEPKEVLLNAENDVLAERQEVHRVKALTTQ
jgi:aminopeptidase N